jgi:hypothetical protein
MARHVLIAVFAAALLAAFPADAQEDDPLLDGAPPPLQVPKPAPRTPAPRPVAPKPAQPDPAIKAEEARLAREAEAQRIEQARLASVAAELDARQARLNARERDLAAQQADYARKLAELDRPPPVVASAPAPALPDRAPRYRITYEDARRACTRAGMSEAVDNDFYSARYASAPRYFERERELRGRMRLDDRDGYLTVDTVCQLDATGAVRYFEILD